MDSRSECPEPEPEPAREPRLYCAVKDGDIQAVRDLLTGATQPEADLNRALFEAINQRNAEVVECLINVGASVHSTSEDDKETPLRRAAKVGDVKVVQLLLDAGAGPPGLTLTYASGQHNLSIVRCLVEHAVDKNRLLNTLYKMDRLHEISPLAAAAESGDIDIARYLVEAGADLFLSCSYGLFSRRSELAIHRAFKIRHDNGTLEMIQYLISVDRKQLNAKTRYGETCLHLAAETNNTGCADWLLSEGANCEVKNQHGETPWQVACRLGDVATIGSFLRSEIQLIGSWHGGPAVTKLWDVFRGGNIDQGDGAILDIKTCSDCFGLPPTSYLTLLDKIKSSFVEHSEPDSALCVREAMCIFETLDDDPGTKFMSLSIPYLSPASLRFLKDRWRHSLKTHKKAKYCCPHNPKDFGADIVVTLDEYCNPNLGSAVLERRNNDQVLTRYVRRLHSKEAPDGIESDDYRLQLVTVPQLWCWKIGSKLILSGLRQTIGQEPYIGTDDNQNLGKLLSRIVDSLDRPRGMEFREPIFSVFSKSISAVAEDVNRYTRSTKFDDISIEEEQRFLHEINDICEEIAMMQTVIFQQEEIWKEFTYNTWPEHWPDGEDGRFRPPTGHDELGGVWREIAKPQAQFPKYRKRFEKLDDDAERVERNILVQLDLKQKHAAIKETHTATVMSAAIVGFTVITIIFAPLSFLTSLFALPIDQFQQNEEGKYTTNYIGKWIATGEIASLAITAAAIWLACEYFLKLRVIRSIWSLVSKPFLKNDYIPRSGGYWTESYRSTDSDSGTDNDSDVRLSIEATSVRSFNPEGVRETMGQETRSKSDFLRDLVKKRQFRKSRRQKSHNPDVENGG
ncbi:hypothetical protein NUW58_g8773 [Xylaria curta]|uniref:Uncharacterized protein n=1 Tax=Xylaria curta TaxID=42375 RepID=A0ACC1N6M4_9PEZI|nr:hypothetical protein NUW58_g8773 [Xylaria curta]